MPKALLERKGGVVAKTLHRLEKYSAFLAYGSLE